jgi:hypothetical protein
LRQGRIDGRERPVERHRLRCAADSVLGRAATEGRNRLRQGRIDGRERPVERHRLRCAADSVLAWHPSC